MEFARHRSSGGPPLMLLLIGLAVLPLLGVVWFGAQEYQDVRRSAQVSDDIEQGTVTLVHLDELRLGLIDEGNWFTARLGAEEIGIPPELIDQVTDVDIDDELQRARARTDASAQALTPLGEDFGAAVDVLRTSDTDELTSLQARYLDLERQVARRAWSLRTQLAQGTTSVEGGGQILSSMQNAEAATTARLQLMQLVWTYFRAEFSILLEAAPDYVELVRLRDSLDSSLQTIETAPATGPRLDAALDQLDNDPAAIEFRGAIDEVIASTFDRDERLRDDDVDILATVVESAGTFTAGVDSIPALDRIVQLADDDVQMNATRVASSMSSEFSRRLLTLALFAAMSLLVAIALARYVGRPMSKIGDAAASLGSGVVFDEAVGGPREVRRVGAALTTAASGLALVERLEHLATHDDLTGIPGRRHFLQRLDGALSKSTRRGTTGALMFVDLDHFKAINDTHGHLAGDQVLRTIADRIGSLLRLDDEVARYGGDEFVVLADVVRSGEEAMMLANRIIDALSEPIALSEHGHFAGETVSVSASLGVALFDETSGSGDEVISRADASAYAAKSAGRNRAVLCDGLVLTG